MIVFFVIYVIVIIVFFILQEIFQRSEKKGLIFEISLKSKLAPATLNEHFNRLVVALVDCEKGFVLHLTTGAERIQAFTFLIHSLGRGTMSVIM